MSRISIDVTDQEHRKLKAMAALQGQSVKDFVLARTIGEQALEADLAELEALLDERIERPVKASARGLQETSSGRLDKMRARARMPDCQLTPDAGIEPLDIALYTLKTWGLAQADIYEARWRATSKGSGPVRPGTGRSSITGPSSAFLVASTTTCSPCCETKTAR